MFVPICFQVWPILRRQIDIFDELLAILWFLPYILADLGKISAQSVKYKKTRNSHHLKDVTFLIYFFEKNILGPNSAP